MPSGNRRWASALDGELVGEVASWPRGQGREGVGETFQHGPRRERTHRQECRRHAGDGLSTDTRERMNE